MTVWLLKNYEIYARAWFEYSTGINTISLSTSICFTVCAYLRMRIKLICFCIYRYITHTSHSRQRISFYRRIDSSWISWIIRRLKCVVCTPEVVCASARMLEVLHLKMKNWQSTFSFFTVSPTGNIWIKVKVWPFHPFHTFFFANTVTWYLKSETDTKKNVLHADQTFKKWKKNVVKAS